MITRASVPSEQPSPSHVEEVFLALQRIEPDIGPLWNGAGIDGRRVAALLDAELTGWSTEGVAGLQEMTWEGSKIRPFRVDGQHGEGISILEVEGGGALQNNRLHRDLLNTMLLDDVEHLVLVVPNRVHGRSPFDYAVEFSTRLRSKGLLPESLTVAVFGYGSPVG